MRMSDLQVERNDEGASLSPDKTGKRTITKRRHRLMMMILSIVLLSASPCHAHNATHYPQDRSTTTTSSTSSSSNKATLTIFDFTSWSYRAEIASFGLLGNNFMDGPSAYHSTLMVPPKNYSNLCQIPQYLLDFEMMHGSTTTTTEHSTTALNPPLLAVASSTSPTITPWRFPGSVSLLVSLEGCHPLQKVQVALHLHSKISRDLKFVVFYNNDPNDPDSIVTLDMSVFPDEDLYSSDNATHQDFQQLLKESGMIFVSVSTGTGTSLLGRMDRLAASTQTSPEFANPSASAAGEFGNDQHGQWHLPMVLEKVPSDRFRPPTWVENDHDGSASSGRDNRYDANDSFFWFRFVLFTLLICSPCLRAAYLWWAGGGRVRLRRDPETNRIVGLQYTPPMQNWFGIHGQQHHEGAAPVHDRLTAEQVMALPEIVYHGEEKATTVGEEQDGSVRLGQSKDGMADGMTTEIHLNDGGAVADTTKVTVDSIDAPQDEIPSLADAPDLWNNVPKENDSTENTAKPLHIQVEMPQIPPKMSVNDLSLPGRERMQSLDEEQPPLGDTTSTSTPVGPFTTTKCNTCSICIDEFEDGERLRLLPRCGHAFHTECILPWLSERQGCCPLCKMSVLETDEIESEGSESSSEQEQHAP